MNFEYQDFDHELVGRKRKHNKPVKHEKKKKSPRPQRDPIHDRRVNIHDILSELEED